MTYNTWLYLYSSQGYMHFCFSQFCEECQEYDWKLLTDIFCVKICRIHGSKIYKYGGICFTEILFIIISFRLISFNQELIALLSSTYWKDPKRRALLLSFYTARSVGQKGCVNKQKFPLTPMGVLARPPIDTSGNFPAHMSAESPSNISPNPLEVISEVSEN